ncbi:hypothetical protein MKX03_014607 [Papaver bracteatum]|nr:hypothetical protein MKX03_014607 [Papaver bracteatum]
MASKIVKLWSQSSKFEWEIENFSQLDAKVGTSSDVFSVGSFKWQAQIFPKGDGGVSQQLSLYLNPVELTKSVYTEFSFAVTSQSTDSYSKVKKDFTKVFQDKKDPGWGTSSFMPLSELHNPEKGYLVNDTCVIRVEVTCTAKEESKDDDDMNECTLNKIVKTENVKQSKENEEESSPELGDYPGAGEPFGEERHDRKVCSCDDKEYEDVGGFNILKTQAPLYKQIWLKYGHIPSTKVFPVSSYPILVMVIRDLMISILDMYQYHYVDLSSETINCWEEKIKMAEKLEFNIGWLRERFECMKKGMGGMQSVKNELLEHGKPLRDAKEKMKILRDAMKKVEVQLIEAKANVRENTCGLLSESDMEMYLDIGEDLLLDGLF